MVKIQYIDVNRLILHPRNPRTISSQQFKKLCKSVKNNPEYFEARPIICNQDMVIVAGNMRYKAALENGLTQVPACVMNLTQEQEKEIMVRDNISNGSWDMDILSADFDISELKDYGLSDADMGLNIDIDFDKISEKSKKDSKRDDFGNSDEVEITCPKCGYKFNA